MCSSPSVRTRRNAATHGHYCHLSGGPSPPVPRDKATCVAGMTARTTASRRITPLSESLARPRQICDVGNISGGCVNVCEFLAGAKLTWKPAVPCRPGDVVGDHECLRHNDLSVSVPQNMKLCSSAPIAAPSASFVHSFTHVFLHFNQIVVTCSHQLVDVTVDQHLPFELLFFKGVPLLECCRVDDTSPENTIVGLPPS